MSIRSVNIDAMNTEQTSTIDGRVAIHAALADPARLRIVDTLNAGDVSPSELASVLAMPSNLLAHHLNVLEACGLVSRRRSEGDRRRSYVHLVRETLVSLVPIGVRSARIARSPQRILFVCTANSARSHLAAALWRQVSTVPVTSAGTRPADRIDPRALAAARRHQVRVPRVRPQAISGVQLEGDLIVTVCDFAHEELGDRAALHWSIPDPVRIGSDQAFDHALEQLAQRVSQLAPQLALS
jgi:protein-tyrosine-phosphatase